MLQIPGPARTLNYGQPVNRQSPLNRGLVSWCLSNPNRGKSATWWDGTQRSNHGVLTNGPAWSGSLGRPGGNGSLSLDGSNDSVNYTLGANRIYDNNAFTYAVWLKWTGTTTLYDFFANGDNAIQTFIDQRSGFDRVVFAVRNGFGGPSVQASIVIDGGWHRWVFTYNGSTQAIYYDGRTLQSDAISFTLPVALDDWLIGAGVGWGNLPGYVDDSRLLERAWSPSEVAADYLDCIQGYPTTLSWHRPKVYFDMGGGGGGASVPMAIFHKPMRFFKQMR